MTLPSSDPTDHQEAAVLTRALLRAATALGLGDQALAKVIYTDESMINRLTCGEVQLQRGSKEWDLALMVMRLYSALLAVVGDEETARAWMNGCNHGLIAVPQQLIVTADGLARTLRYLESAASIS